MVFQAYFPGVLIYFFLNLFVVFIGHDIGFTFLKSVIFFFFLSFSNIIVLGRSFALQLVAVNMYLKLLREYSTQGAYQLSYQGSPIIIISMIIPNVWGSLQSYGP